MAIVCKRCGRQYDVSLFQFGRTVVCECGETLNLSHEQTLMDESFLQALEELRQENRQKAEELKRMVERVCVLILSTDVPKVDIEIEKEKVRQRCQELFPDRMGLYEMIYESRFERLWEQFRSDGSEPWNADSR